jgi:hypothetical protein
MDAFRTVLSILGIALGAAVVLYSLLGKPLWEASLCLALLAAFLAPLWLQSRKRLSNLRWWQGAIILIAIPGVPALVLYLLYLFS